MKDIMVKLGTKGSRDDGYDTGTLFTYLTRFYIIDIKFIAKSQLIKT